MAAVTVNLPIVASAITASPNPVNLGAPVNFSITATGGTRPYAYSWAFGDGGIGGDLANITHIYTTNGPFVAVAIVTDAAGESVNQRLNMTIALNASIFSNASLGAAPLPVGFQSVVQGGTPGYTYAWNFGDGAQAATPNPNHTYVSSGDYRATLRVTDRVGLTATSSWLENVVVGGGQLEIHVSASRSEIPAGGSTMITASPEGGFGRYVLTWSGYPPGCTEATPTALNCTPTATGSYTVVANVTDAAGATAQATVGVAVGLSSSAPGPSAGTVSVVTAGVITIGAAAAVAAISVYATRARHRTSEDASRHPATGRYSKYASGGPPGGRPVLEPVDSPSEDSLSDLI